MRIRTTKSLTVIRFALWMLLFVVLASHGQMGEMNEMGKMDKMDEMHKMDGMGMYK